VAGPPSMDSATRVPVPVTIRAIAMPLAPSPSVHDLLQPATGCTSVRALAVGHPAEEQAEAAAVLGRPETSPAAARNVNGSSAA
jgi:hypothetical protein